MTFRCQYIAGEPSGTDDCKCGRPTVTDSVRPYCATHLAICYPPGIEHSDQYAWGLLAATYRRGAQRMGVRA